MEDLGARPCGDAPRHAECDNCNLDEAAAPKLLQGGACRERAAALVSGELKTAIDGVTLERIVLAAFEDDTRKQPSEIGRCLVNGIPEFRDRFERQCREENDRYPWLPQKIGLWLTARAVKREIAAEIEYKAAGTLMELGILEISCPIPSGVPSWRGGVVEAPPAYCLGELGREVLRLLKAQAADR